MAARTMLRRRRSSTLLFLFWTLTLVIAISFVFQGYLMQEFNNEYANADNSRFKMKRVSSHQQKKQRQKRWAYVFLLADIDPDQASYRGMMYNILVATYSLKFNNNQTLPRQPAKAETDDKVAYAHSTHTSSSKADVIVLLQMAESTTHSHLPEWEANLFQRMDIQLRYLPKPAAPASTIPTFYQLVMAKFHVWDMIDYTRILFLDSDVLPLCSLDYLMELSESSGGPLPLKETVLHAMYDDPVNAGLFVVTPNRSHFQELQKLVQSNGAWMTDTTTTLPDYRLWQNLGETKHGWDFYCANSDQGLLLHWSRIVRRQVSIIVGPTIEHYDGDSRMTVPSQYLSQFSCLPAMTTSSQQGNNNRKRGRQNSFAQNANPQAASLPFYQDFFHMVGYGKAWEMPLTRPVPRQLDQVQNSWEYWYFLLAKVKQEFDEENVIPPLEALSETIQKPKLRGDLFEVKDMKVA